MVYDGALQGKYVDLKSCTEEDAEFTRTLRQDPRYKDCFPTLNNTLEQQREWIRNQRKKTDDYFFVVWDKKGNRIGTISIYNICEGQAEGGRIICIGNPIETIEMQLLQSRFAFYYLNLKMVYGYVFADNKKALRFNQSMGANLLQPELINGRIMIRIEKTRSGFDSVYAKYSKILYR